MNLQRILFIAPSDSGLDVTPEQQALYEYGFHVQVVAHTVTRQRLFDVARRASFDILHFAAHASRDGVILSGGEILDATGIVQLARLAKATLIFLNGCETAELGQILVDEGIPAAIVTLASVPDNMAKETAQLFYAELARTRDIRQAYRQSKPPVKGGYALLLDGHMLELELGPIIQRLDDLQALLADNRREHELFRNTIADNIREIGEVRATSLTAKRLKLWFVQVLTAYTVVVTLIQIMLVLIR